MDGIAVVGMPDFAMLRTAAGTATTTVTTAAVIAGTVATTTAATTPAIYYSALHRPHCPGRVPKPSCVYQCEGGGHGFVGLWHLLSYSATSFLRIGGTVSHSPSAQTFSLRRIFSDVTQAPQI